MKRLILGIVLLCIALTTTQAMSAPRKSTPEDTQRAKYAAEISKRWGPQIERRYGMPAGDWSEKMLGTFTSADLGNLKRAAAAKSFNEMSGALFGGSSAANMKLARPTVIGSTENDLVFTPLPPCRLLDTRKAGGKLAAGVTRSFIGWTATDFVTQGGSATNCGIPENASAVLTNVVAVNTSIKLGYLVAYPSDIARPNASTVNFVGGDIANEIALKLCRPGCPVQFSVFSTAATDLVVDTYGYYMEPVATPLDCTTATGTGGVLNANFVDVTTTCPVGYTGTGGGCGGPLGLTVGGSRPSVDGNGTPNGWTCTLATSLPGGLIGYRVDATCCRLPGR